jgi:glyoxylase-like metal-dependent hydrolase (beta-lactamase superfamily II)
MTLVLSMPLLRSVLVGSTLMWLAWLAPVAALAQPADDAARVQNRGTDTARWWDALPRPAWAAFPRVAEQVAWYEIHRIRPDTYAIYEPGQFEEVISYLILGERRALLFDTGLGIGNMQAAVAAVTDLPLWVLNSHSHYDHIGGNHQFDGLYGRDTEYTRSRQQGLPNEEVAQAVTDGWIWKPVPAGFDRATYHIRPYTIDRVVDEGFEFDLGGRTLQVLVTPGHAPDAVCLLDRRNRLLFTGDTFYPAPLYTHIAGADFDSYHRSAARLAELQPLVDYLLPGHNEPRVSSTYLARMAAAFDGIAAGTAEFVVSDDLHEYGFDGFSVLVPAAHAAEQPP